MSSSGYRRRPRAPKPLRVPALGVLFGVVLFVVGMALSSAAVASLGMLIAFWGVLSFSVLAISRRVRAARATQGAGPRR